MGLSKEIDRIGGQISANTNRAIRNAGNFYQRNAHSVNTIYSGVGLVLAPFTAGASIPVASAVVAANSARNVVIDARKNQQRIGDYNARVIAIQKQQTTAAGTIATNGQISADANYGSGSVSASGATGVAYPTEKPATLGQVITSGNRPVLIVVSAIILIALNTAVKRHKHG